ncbi:MAG TPA: alpha-ketoglutarate-dependent dioxygenase AlkB [Lysobacter sp.]
MSAVLQPSLFTSGPRLLVEDAEGGVHYRPELIDSATAQHWFDALRESVAWQAQRRPMYDRVVDVPRLVSGYRLDAPDLPAALAAAAALLHAALGQPFNAVGLNYYRDGRDSVAPHNDKLHSLVPGHPIALLSLGAPRRMTIRGKQLPRHAFHVDLEPGSLLLMSYDSQLHYEHGIPKTRGPVGPRISLAFRVRPPGRTRLP